MSSLTLRESILACIRKSLVSSMRSRTSQRRFLSDDRGLFILFIWISCSREEMDTISLPTTAMVLSNKPLG